MFVSLIVALIAAIIVGLVVNKIMEKRVLPDAQRLKESVQKDIQFDPRRFPDPYLVLGRNPSKEIVWSGPGKNPQEVKTRSEVDSLNLQNQFKQTHLMLGRKKRRSQDTAYLYTLDCDTYTREGKVEDAQIQLQLALDILNSETPETLYLSSRIADLENLEELAVKFCSQALAGDSSNCKYLQQMGLYRWKYGNALEEAIEFQEEALRNTDRAADTFKMLSYNNLAYYYASLGDEERVDEVAILKADKHLQKIQQFEGWMSRTAIQDTIGFVTYRKFLAGKTTQSDLIWAYRHTFEASKRDEENYLIKKHLFELESAIGVRSRAGGSEREKSK